MGKIVWLLISACVVMLLPSATMAQPSRQMPGLRPYLPGSPLRPIPEANSRTTSAPSQTGLQSTDFYGKKGYPRVLGDAVETGSSSGGTAAGTTGGISGGSISGGVGGGIGGGGLTGGGLGGGLSGGGGALGGFGNLGSGNAGAGLTGGGFSGLVPKGFGFGGTPSVEYSYSNGQR